MKLLFRLTFGTEAMIPIKIGEPSPRTAPFEPSTSGEKVRLRGNPPKFRGWGPSSKESHSKYRKEQTNTVLGGTIQGNRRSWPRSVSLGKPGKEKVASYVECRLSANVLQLNE
ncbi:hypothetical protein CR513_08706, partial [Mucuna pruriens]